MMSNISNFFNLGVEYVNSVPPCAGLSMLNRSQGRGADAPMNDWLYLSATYVLKNIRPKCYWGENAPGLFMPAGHEVVKKLRLVKN